MGYFSMLNANLNLNLLIYKHILFIQFNATYCKGNFEIVSIYEWRNKV